MPLYQLQLVLAARDNRLSGYAEYNDIARFFRLRGIAFDDVYNDLFFQRVVFGTVFLQLGDVLLECTHFLLITQYFDDITAGNDAKLGIQGLYQLHVGVVYAIKYYRVNIFKNNQFFYH